MITPSLSLKTSSPKDSTESGISISIRLGQSAKACTPISFTPYFIVTFLRFAQFWKPKSFIVVTVPGIVTSVSPVLQNAASPIKVTPSGMSACSRLVQSANEYSPISVTVSGIVAETRFSHW